MRAAARSSLAAIAVGAALLAAPAHAQMWESHDATNWAGFYAGVNLGSTFDSNSLSIRDQSALQDLSIQYSNSDAFIGGGHVGYNLQGARILYGVEGDFDFGENIDFLGSIRAKLGWAGDRVAVYGTLGVAYISAESAFTITSPSQGVFNLTSDYGEFGFVGGGGLDFKVLPALSLGVDGLWYQFGNDSDNLVAGTAPFIVHNHPSMAAVRGRITYHFNTGY
jgi:outer membrane immunogenic protein